MSPDTDTHILYLRQAVDEIKGDVKYLRENVVTKDDCTERHRHIDHTINLSIGRREFDSFKKIVEEDIGTVKDDVKEVKRPLWALVITFLGAVFTYFFTRGGN